MNILVTGGAGFIGSHVVGRFLRDAHRVICLDSLDDSYDPEIKRENISPYLDSERFSFIEGDIRDGRALEEAFSQCSINLVIHLAARAGVRPSIRNPELYYDVNVVGTLRLLEAMRRYGVSQMLFASSSSVYGNNTKVPFSEMDSVDHPISPYAASKRAGELICYTYHSLYGFDVYCLRFFTVYGPRQRPEMAINQFITRSLDEQPITMFGDGTSRRDYTYIDDILDGIVKASICLRGFETINLGESRTISLNSLIGIIERLIGKKAVIDRQPMQAGDVMVTYADISKAQRVLGYSPCFPIEEGIARHIEWLRGMRMKSPSFQRRSH